MTRWHPATKLLLLLAVVAVPYLIWTSSPPAPPGGAAAVARASRPEAAAAAEAEVERAEAAVEARRRALPPLQTFAAMVERPLFTPTRRLVRPVEAPPPEEPRAEDEPAAAAQAAAEEEPPEQVGKPELRFFGTVRQRGRVTALVTREGEPAMEQLGVGDGVDEWTVEEVTRSRLVLALDGRKAEYAIFEGAAAGSPAP